MNSRGFPGAAAGLVKMLERRASSLPFVPPFVSFVVKVLFGLN
jgi:hypothetical protein